MQRQIDLLGKSYTVTITGEHGAQQFQVDDDKPCPAVLIDKKGIIIAKGLRGNMLKQKLSDIFN